MLLSTPGLVLHTTPYAETSVVAKVFTRQLGVRSYIIKGVRSRTGRVKQNLLQPLTSLDMVVYDNHRSDLNYIREMSPRQPQQPTDPVAMALRMFMTEVLYRSLREQEPMQDLWDYVSDELQAIGDNADGISRSNIPITFMLRVAHHLGIEPLDNFATHTPYFSLQEGRYVASSDETSLPLRLSELLHTYLSSKDTAQQPSVPLNQRTDIVNSLLAYYQLHLSGFRNFSSHEILHTVLN